MCFELCAGGGRQRMMGMLGQARGYPATSQETRTAMVQPVPPVQQGADRLMRVGVVGVGIMGQRHLAPARARIARRHQRQSVILAALFDQRDEEIRERQ